MIFCVKCSRLLDEDLRFCPYCKSEDPDFKNNEDVFEKLRRINEHVGEQAGKADELYNPPIRTEDSLYNLPASTESDKKNIYAEITETPEIIESEQTTAAEKKNPGETFAPLQPPLPPFPQLPPFPPGIPPYRNNREVPLPPPMVDSSKIPEEPKPSTALYVSMVLLAFFLGFPSIIIGIVLLTRKNKHYQSLGTVIIIIALFSAFIGSAVFSDLFSVF